ncbi:NAD(P)-binding protein [Endozoicomonas ascidiicola]|uniref:NAD(P)-binding protein n=1 Tax=Endozoicomonas ascidiicola TaxID=1698521 RepID=UPI000BA4201A|nr:NAD(P)-binding protein [Endozoicomonas ascidiicola]
MKIAVIGSGLSGIKTASLLHKIGHEVTVFEKSRGFGGRMALNLKTELILRLNLSRKRV